MRNWFEYFLFNNLDERYVPDYGLFALRERLGVYLWQRSGIVLHGNIDSSVF
jgi:hypothetical protein